MPYAILRTAKLKTFGEIGGSLAHTYRDRETLNADPARTPLNEHWGPETAAEVQKAIRERLPEKRRSDAVLCIEYFIGRSPEWQGDDVAYFDQAVAWLEDRHGAENVISAHVHRDETTPHLVAYVVPRDGEKLNAKKWLGGRAVLSAMQTDFWERVGRQHGLDRGEEGSIARHQTIKEYYARANQAETVLKVDYPMEREGKGLMTKESDAEFAHRVARAVHDQMIGNFVKGQEAPKIARREREQAQEVSRLRRALAAAQDRLTAYDALIKGLSSRELLTLTRAADQIRENARKATSLVVGWLKDISRESMLDDWRITVRDRETGKDVTVLSERAGEDLRRAGAAQGDLVQLGTEKGKVLEKARQQGRKPPTQERGPER
jgi:hypothetical protein